MFERLWYPLTKQVFNEVEIQKSETPFCRAAIWEHLLDSIGQPSWPYNATIHKYQLLRTRHSYVLGTYFLIVVILHVDKKLELNSLFSIKCKL